MKVKNNTSDKNLSVTKLDGKFFLNIKFKYRALLHQRDLLTQNYMYISINKYYLEESTPMGFIFKIDL